MKFKGPGKIPFKEKKRKSCNAFLHSEISAINNELLVKCPCFVVLKILGYGQAQCLKQYTGGPPVNRDWVFWAEKAGISRCDAGQITSLCAVGCRNGCALITQAPYVDKFWQALTFFF